MPFGSNSPKFPLGRVSFDGHQGLGGPVPGGMVPNEMVMYPVGEVCEWQCGGRVGVCMCVSICVYLIYRMVAVQPLRVWAHLFRHMRTCV